MILVVLEDGPIKVPKHHFAGRRHIWISWTKGMMCFHSTLWHLLAGS